MNTDTQLTLNLLGFSHAEKNLTAYVSTIATENRVKLSERDRDYLVNCLQLSDSTKELYTTFDKKEPDSTAISQLTSYENSKEGDRAWSFSFLKKYYTYKLTEHFRSLEIPARNNFVSDTDVWIKCNSPLAGCDGYRVFTLRVQFNYPDKQPQLMVIPGEVHSVYHKPVNNEIFSECPEKYFTWVLYQNEVFRYDSLPDTAFRHKDEVFPCMNPDLKHVLNIRKPAPDKSNRYLKHRSETEEFRKTYLEGNQLKGFMIIDQKWSTVQPKRLNVSGLYNLKFGEGVHSDPIIGMKQFGPKELIRDEVVFFFIMHRNDIPLAHTVNDYLKGTKSDFKGGLHGYLGLKYNTESKLSIVFENSDNPLPEIETKLNENNVTTFEDGRRYVAIYLSPHSKFSTNLKHKAIYFQIKELLLIKGIVSQTLDVEKIRGKERKTIQEDDILKAVIKDNFRYFLPNILVAIYAKLGATPWCFEQQTSDELVIGISAYKSRELDKKYLGSAFSFTNEGRFQGFECFRSTQLSELAGSIALAVKEYCSEYKSLQRLVIHLYKRLSWRELQPIEKALATMGLSVPVVVVAVNKEYSDDLVGFDLSRPNLMPLTGLYFSMNRNQYLLYNNKQLVGNENTSEREGYPFPLKITLQKFMPGTTESAIPDQEEMELLFEQVCRFSQLYWKSVSRQWIPVTLRYPELLAQIAPHFKYHDIHEFRQGSLWFL